MSTVLLGTNRIEDCQTLIAVRDHAVLRVEASPPPNSPRLMLSTPPGLRSGRSLTIEDNRLVSANEIARALNPKVFVAGSTVSVFLGDTLLLLATQVDPETVHVKLDLRPLGINVYDDAYGLHVGPSTLARNHLSHCPTAIGLT